MESIVQSNTLLEIEGLRVWFPIVRGVFSRVRGHIKAVDGVSLFIRRGETVGLVGESGCGKTTLGRAIMGLEQAREGRIVFDGKDLSHRHSTAEARLLARRRQMIFQDPYSSLNPRMTVLDILTEGMEEHGLMEGSKEESALRLLSDVGLDRAMLHRYPFEFSGGQRQRISIARALSVRPEFIVCDEPISALDVSIQAQIINLMMELRQKYSLSYLFISHDLSVVRHVADRVAVMYLGRIVEEGPSDEVIENPLHPYTQALISAVPVPGEEGRKRIVLKGDLPSPSNPPKGCPFHPRCPYAMKVCKEVDPPPAQRGAHRVNCHLHPPGPAS
ncbi:MAG TPA: peptide ABC transporter substrate-binding protein [Verrucomicrobia bacterium]|nr:peptide ABC transporter substrate-binding protein [Verrucomicrobiota bacterium]